MKKEWILWNALKEPESIIKDERMEQIQWKSYYWCYRTLIRILIFLMIFWPMILDLLKKYLGESLIGEMFFQLLTFGIISVMETGRFLYSCYYGNQEFYEKGKGKWNFWSCSLSMGAFPWLMFFIFCGAKHPLPWVMAVLGILLAVFLSHLAYLHFALLIDEETGEKGRRSEAWIPKMKTPYTENTTGKIRTPLNGIWLIRENGFPRRNGFRPIPKNGQQTCSIIHSTTHSPSAAF